MGNEPNDTWDPSIKYGTPKFDEEEQECPAAVLCGQNIRNSVQCSSCSYGRGVYAKRKLLHNELAELAQILSEYDYVCGSHVIPNDSFLKGKLFTRVR